jgi:3-keto-L-gulonate-6-phosphate decarboxylase
MIDGAKFLEDLGCDYVIHHIGYDERRGIAAAGKRMPSPLDQLREVVKAVKIPVQAVGGLSLEQAIQCPKYGAPLVVLGSPLTIDANAFKTADGNLEASLRMICEDMVAGAKWLKDLGCDYVIHHIGYDERRGIAAAGNRMPSPLDKLREVVQAVKVPVQAVGGLSLEQAIQCPKYGAPLVVLGAPLTIDADAFKTADGNLEASLRLICEAVHAQDVPAFQ